ncbi:MAG: DUF4405 domain-containing protein [Anaerolineae bacterium]|nr:DUF4405 domain-containing protein [Anaerolineae bacterium]
MNRTNLAIDAGIFTAFLGAMNPELTGISIHEWLSVAFAMTVIVHVALHWRWVIEVAQRFFERLWNANRLKLVVDGLLFIAVTGVMTSGLMISRSVLPTLGIAVGENFTWRALHSLTANLSLTLTAVHFALSWHWIVAAVRRFVLQPAARLFKPKAQPSVLVPVMKEVRHD